MNRIVRNTLIAFAALFVLIQLVPYGRNHDNPPVVKEPNWDSPQTRELAVRACFDCHSNESKWPFYSNIAPVSWFVYDHVEEGREHLNFSDWNNPHANERCEGDREQFELEIAKSIKDGYMPLDEYLLLHPEAQLTGEEKAQLIEGLVETVKNSP